MSDVIVAIKCLVYNHEPYLRDCLEGFVMQQTNFPFVAIVHDDASTDGSAAIIREYEEKYPNIIKPIYETENQYSKHDGSVGRIVDAAIDDTGAKYVAMCEGDDYWTDPLKLQKQVDFLEANPEYSMCFHGAQVRNTTNLGIHIHCTNIENRDYSATEVFAQWVVPTASIVYVKSIVNSFKVKHPEWILYGDIVLIEKCCHSGKVYGMEDVMSVYRMQNDSIVHNPKYQQMKLLKMPNHFRFLQMNFQLIDKKVISWCLSQAYYARFRRGKTSFAKKTIDLLQSIYYQPSFFTNKIKKLICRK